MTQKWNSAQTETEYSDGDTLYAADLNDTLAMGFRHIVPVGTILPWAKSISGVPSLPDGWQECDGSVVSDADSPINGQNVPDLNTTQRFLRGASTSGTTGGSDTNGHSHTLTTSTINLTGGGTYFAIGTTTGGASSTENRPAFYEVVFIMRIK